MSQQRTDNSSTETIDAMSQDVLLEVFSNQRRRLTVQYLKQNGDQTTISQLTDQVASWENQKPIAQLTTQERKRVRNALRQFHLPKMADYGFIEYDSKRGMIALTTATAEANFYVDSLTGREIPWGVYYLGFSALSLGGLLGIWASVYPFALVSPLMYAVFVVTALSVSSIGHFYDNYYRMRLGGRSTPDVSNP